MLTLLGDVADLAAPGSRLLFDFLHADALTPAGAAAYPGYAACAEVGGGCGRMRAPLRGWAGLGCEGLGVTLPCSVSACLPAGPRLPSSPPASLPRLPRLASAQSVAGKGEAFVSGFEPEEGPLSAALAPLGWRLAALRSPRAMAAAQLPHLAWSEELPPILAFYSYAEVEKA